MKIKKSTRIIILIVGLLLLAFPQIVQNDYYIQTAIMIAFFAYMASCWNILGGLAGQISFGHSVYAGIGAYTSTLLFIYLGISPWLGMLLGGLLAGVIAVLIGMPTFRLQGTYYTLSTIAFLTVVRILVLSNPTILGLETRGAQGMIIPLVNGGDSPANMQFLTKTPIYYVIIIMLVVVAAITNYLKNSKTGYYFSAIKTNQDAAAALGVNVSRYKLICAFISAFLTALGGTFYAQLAMYVDPSTLLGNEMGQQFGIIAIVGGRGTILGPIIGSLVLVPLQEIGRALFGGTVQGFHLVLYGLIMMIIVLFLPDGLVSLFKKLKPKNIKKSTNVNQLGANSEQ
ncbi:MAG: branched-chain amino acid ABC transporter permease [Eubacteriales bacterium]|nr:branched-chain amino acid ABC transporter permease [Eubacteriales bacterium]MDD4324045.1 branched-chain amino acid ABC transporter permease [Eubacteriales bacterium]MDD4541515.1 branched-chain amino acid ABC transporter permease [Eubacteriales bacterium]